MRKIKKPKIPDETYWRGQKPVANLILKKIKKNNNVLEMGIGKGGVTKYLLKKQPFLNVVGFDINESSLKKANDFLKKNCKGKFKLLKTSQDISLVKKFGREKFDFVISCGVLDYSKNPDNVIKNIKNILKPDGFFAFTLFDNLSSTDYKGKIPKQMYISKAGIKTWGYRDFYIKKLLKKIGFKLHSISLFKRLHTNTHIELSHTEIKAIRNNLDDPYDDHFVILVSKK
ncbi:MAG: class I SAM-dependent methyltransferase [Candidatus Melainabacteria bacterium]|nr:class I SAM-dependent methyltransferase [Candidatus Melainabacteria bacterium]